MGWARGDVYVTSTFGWPGGRGWTAEIPAIIDLVQLVQLVQLSIWVINLTASQVFGADEPLEFGNTDIAASG